MTARELLSAMAFCLATGETPKTDDWYPDPRSFEAAVDTVEVEARAAALAEYAAKIREDASLCIDGLADECCQAYGVALARWLPRPARSSTMEQFTEYAVRVTLPGFQPRITPCATFVRDAHRAYDHAVSLHGRDAVEFLTREVTRSEWLASTLPPPPVPPDPDGGLCDPMPRVRAVVTLPLPSTPAAGETVTTTEELL